MIHIKRKLFDDLNVSGKPAVLVALQQALKLEHATIPPYLYALYSLDEEKNGDIAEIIQSVVVEEMLHMTLVCNIVNALGGCPIIDRRIFVPSYPGPLPGGVAGGLEVGLAPFSLDLVHDVFMEIEEPEVPLEFPVEALADDVEEPLTIGQFYEAIKEQIVALGDEAFVNPPRNQVRALGAIEVTNVESASEAIDMIIEQGEGTAQSPEEGFGGDDVAHYYRFAEIYHGRQLIENPNPPSEKPEDQYIYGGDPIPFDETGVFPVPTNPKRTDYVGDPAALHACDTFNYTYTNLLKMLHATFNGQDDQMNAAIGVMMSLKVQAKDMMSGIYPVNKHVGPSFEYQPLNPPISSTDSQQAASATKSGQFAVDSSEKNGTLFTNEQASEGSVTFTASGTWNTGSKHNYGPEGKSGTTNKKAQYPDSTLYALLAVNSSNEVVGEGASITLTLQPNESVRFVVNDTHYPNNRGVLTVGWKLNP